MRVEDLFAHHARELRQAGGDSAAPVVRPVWDAFLAAAAQPVGELTPTVDEDFLLFEVSLEDEAEYDPPVVMDLVRRVSLADPAGDYVGSYVLTCSWSYGTQAGPLDEVQITGNGGLAAPTVALTLELFAREVEASEAFRRLADTRPEGFVISEGPG